MMKRSLLFLVLLAVPAFAEDPSPRIREGIRLHDAGRYAEAIAVYKEVLAKEPSNAFAAYELAYTYMSVGDAANCVATVEPLLGKAGDLQSGAYLTYGSCLDMSGEPEKAVAAFRKGLEIAPGDPLLGYNLALTLVSRNELDEARELLKAGIRKDAGHRSSHYLLAKVFEAQQFRVPALLSYLRFLALEPATERSKDAAAHVRTLLAAGVTKTKEGANIAIATESRTEEGDYQPGEFGLALAASSMTLEINARKSEFERWQGAVSAALAILTEGERGNDFTAEVNLPFFANLIEQKQVDAFVYTALQPLNLSGADAWAKKNKAVLDRYAAAAK